MERPCSTARASNRRSRLSSISGIVMLAIAGLRVSSHAREALEIHLQDVEPAREAVDRVDDLALVDEYVVELDRVHLGHARGRRHEGGDLSRLIGIGEIVGAQAAIEE